MTNQMARAIAALSCISVLLASSLLAQSLEVPYLAGHVNDHAGMLSTATIEELEQTLRVHEDSTSNQVAVLIIPSLQGEVLEEYSIKVVETWKLGQADKDNGVLLLIARDDRIVRIEVGNGLEGDLPDITCGRIVRDEIVPRFRDGDYEAGVRAGVTAILAAIAGSYQPIKSANNAPDWVFRLIFFSIFAVVVGIFTMISIITEGKAGWSLYFFLIPFWLAFPMVSFGLWGGGIMFVLYLVGVGAYKLWLAKTPKGKARLKKWAGATTPAGKLSGLRLSSSSSSSSSFRSSSSSSSFSGGGGSFSGGGASGKW